LARGSIVVTGTNGKTTTSRMIASILRLQGLRVVHNRSGANMIAGVTSALLDVSGLAGRPMADIGLFEIDEAVLPALIREVPPVVTVFTNLFRDQLDRYGEVDFVADTWRKALRTLTEHSTVILNADDPLVSSLGAETRARVLYFGLEDERHGRSSRDHTADTRACTSCGNRLAYTVSYYGHVGKYYCPHCGLSRPEPQYRALAVELQGTTGSLCHLATAQGTLDLRIPVPGLYNVYNSLAAASATLALGIPPATVKTALEVFSAAFGRIERIAVDGRNVFMALVKNPVGFNEVLRTIFLDPSPKRVLIIINDNIADGTDISWLWDVDFEVLQGNILDATVSGTRAADMAVRLKYALVDPAKITVLEDQREALHRAITETPAGETLYVLPTYTAMLALRALMHRLGYVGRFWED
jgi:UDP-N-acetylmuramyl tripeptide synthase